jgi:hypothetical protein
MLPEVVHDWTVYKPSVVVDAPVTVTTGRTVSVTAFEVTDSSPSQFETITRYW